MSRIDLVIADKDAEYAARLAECLLQSYGHVYDINACCSRETLTQNLKRAANTPDVLLADEALYAGLIDGNEENISMPGCTVLLSEEQKPGPPRTIFKYRHVSQISNDIISAYYEHGGKKDYPLSGETNTKLIGISSACGGAGKSTFAACIAVQCSIRGHTALIMSLEEIPSTSCFFREEPKNNLSHVFFKIKSGEKDISAAIEGCAAMSGNEGLYYMPAPENPLEYCEISTEDMRSLLHSARNLGKYDYVFIDMQSGYSLKTEMLMNECDIVFMLIKNSGLAAAKNKEIARALKGIKNESKPDMPGKFIPVWCDCIEGQSCFENTEFCFENPQSDGKNTYDRLPYEPDFLRNPCTEVFCNPSNQYVQAVAEILRKHIISRKNYTKQEEQL